MGNVPPKDVASGISSALQLGVGVAEASSDGKPGKPAASPTDLLYKPMKRSLIADGILCKESDEKISVCPSVFQPVVDDVMRKAAIGVGVLAVLMVGLMITVVVTRGRG